MGPPWLSPATEHRCKSNSWKLSGNLRSQHLANRKGQFACKGLEDTSFARNMTHLVIPVSMSQILFLTLIYLSLFSLDFYYSTKRNPRKTWSKKLLNQSKCQATVQPTTRLQTHQKEISFSCTPPHLLMSPYNYGISK